MAAEPLAPGFPAGVASTPVPSPLLGHLLAEISDASELRFTLRFIWRASQKKGLPRPVRLDELLADRVIAGALGLGGDELAAAVLRAAEAAGSRGTLARYPAVDGVEAYVLNTEPERRALARVTNAGDRTRLPAPPKASPATGEPAQEERPRPNIYVAYEQNIGPLTPMAGELLKQAALSFPEEWIREAIQIAVSNNARNWKYVSAILDRWASEGKAREQPGRDLQEERL